MNNLKKIIALVLMLALITLPSWSWAAVSTTGGTQTARITSLKTRADTEINRRVTALNVAVSKVSSLKRLNASEQASFTSQINQNISDLTSLKSKIDADTDPTVLQTDVQSIVTDYRIFAVFIPQIHLLAAVDSVNTTTAKLTTLSTMLQQRITIASENGQNIGSLNTTLTDLNTKITDANNLASSIAISVTPLTPAGYPDNKTTLQTAVTSLNTARTDITGAQNDAKTIMASLKALENSPSS